MFTNDNDFEAILMVRVAEVLTFCGQTYDRQNYETYCIE